jgi:membrane associated rhomboid family serine protease
MGIAAAIVGAVGGLSAVMGILTILEVKLNIGDQFTWMFWLVLAGVLLLGSIALSVGKGPVGD